MTRLANVGKTLESDGFSVQNATMNSPVVIVKMDSLESFIAKARQIGASTIYEIRSLRDYDSFYLAIDSRSVGYEYFVK